MAFQQFQTPSRNSSNKGVSLDLEEREHGTEITSFLNGCTSQQQRILYLNKRGWSAKQIASVLVTQKGTPTPVQHVNQVLAKARGKA